MYIPPMKTHFGAVLVFCGGLLFEAGGAQAKLAPVAPRCEYATNPLGVDNPRPRLFWSLESAERGQRQTAYQIVAASSAELLANDRGDLWDSGKVVSAESIQIPYQGQALKSSQGVFWKTRVWDQDGQVSAWSPAGSWTMGIVSPADWRAKWIESPDSSHDDAAAGNTPAPPTGLPVFRKAFQVASPLRRAIVHVTGLGHYDLFVDGKKAGDHFLDPAWSVYEKTVYYTTFDLTRQLEPGAHVFAVMLGKGFYSTAGDRRVHGVNVRRPLKLLLQARLTYADGTEQVLVSDGSWKCAAGPITHSAILGGEDYDARRLPRGWQRTGFDDTGWRGAVVSDGPGGALTASYSPPLTPHEVFKAKTIEGPEPGVFVYDFGQNASAVPRLRVRGKAGQTLKLIPAEQRHGMSPRRNDGSGLVNQAGVGSPNYWQYTLAGEPEEHWTPQFSYSGFQYLQLEGAVPAEYPNPEGKPVVEELESVHVRNDAATVGHFACSNPLFNRIDQNIDWAVRANLSHVLTDCPHREKLGWLEVSYLMGPSIAGRYDIARFYSKVSRDCAASQTPDGMIPTVAPAFPAFGGGFAYTPEWGAAGVVNPWLLYAWYGDREVLDASYPMMRGFVDFMEKTGKDLVPRPGLGDWYDYGHGKPVGESQFTPPELSAMATFHRCARIVADAAGVLGRQEDQTRYTRLAERIAAAFNARFFDGAGEYQNHGSPQTANSMALISGMVPRGREPAVLERLMGDLQNRGYQQTAGDIGYWYLLATLARHGRSDAIFRMATRTNLGSYGYIVQNGWTAMPEAWDANTGASMNHCMLGHIQEWFLGWVAGIRPDPDTAGFGHFLIQPNPVGDLTWARGSYDSIRGPIRVAWRKTKDSLVLEADIPANCTATLSIPAVKADAVKEGDRPAATSPGVTFVRIGEGRAVYAVTSGRFRFISAL